MKKALITLAVAAAAISFTATSARADHTNTHTNAITCDFTALADAVDALEVADIEAPNNNARRGRLNSLENAVEDAQHAATNGHLSRVLDALEHIAKKTGTDRNAWVVSPASDDIQDALDDLLDCLDDVVAGGGGNTNGTNNADCFENVRGNKQTHRLDAGTNSCDLVLRGNNNRVLGSTTGETVIDGDVLITGNGNTLRNVTVTGTITLRGNNNRLVDVEDSGDIVDTGNNNSH